MSTVKGDMEVNLRILMGLEAGDKRAAGTRFSEIKEEDVIVYRDITSGESLVLPSTRPRKTKKKKSRSNRKIAQIKRNDEVVSSATNFVFQQFLAIGALTPIVLLVYVLTGAQSIITGGKEDSSGNRSWGHEDNNSFEHEQKRKLFLRNLQQDGLSQSTIPPLLATIPTPFPSNGASSTSNYPTFSPANVCNPDPANCGCRNLNQADYRGSVNTTVNGVCIKWDDENLNTWWNSSFESSIFQEYPDSGLEENYCRNPDNDPRGPWCFTEPNMADDGTGYWVADYCDVSVCSTSSTVNPTSNPPSSIPAYTLQPTHVPSPSLGPPASSSPTTTCKVADKSTCGCNLVLKSDYRGTISTTQNGADCERWDANWIDLFNETLRKEGLDENYCRNPFNDAKGPGCFTSVNIFGDNGLPQMSSCSIPACDPCMCMPDCDKSNSLKCGCPNALQADECCKGDDSECRCQYLKDACRKSIESNITIFCDYAEVECCSNDANPNCKCAFYEQMCFEFPSQSTCEYAALSCCKPLLEYDYAVPETCFCDFYTSTKSGYESMHRPGNCSKAEEAAYGIPENEALRSFYDNLGGPNWHNSYGWLDDATRHCQWFGISCNENGLVTKIELRSNNIVGKGYQVFYTLVGALKELKVLNVANNTLTGEVLSGYIPTFMKLEHIDLSNNGLSGHADLTLPLSTLYVNFSHNLLSSIGFKRFNAAYETLKVVDLSNNNISQDASKLFFNIPPNIQELILSNNFINGNLPDSFELKNVIRFAMANNKIEGTIPYFPEYAPLLQELDLSNQKRANTAEGLSGTILMDIYKLIDLSSLNLAGNMLTGEIPTSIGNLDKLKLLNLSSNELSKQIPSELGRLKSKCCT
jgi:Leucine-rich repeat (LRR) protein